MRTSRRTIWIHLLLYPGHTLPTAAAPVLVAAGLAWRDGRFAAWPLALAFLGSWLIHVAGVFADNHELLRRHRGLAEHPELTAAVDDGSLRLRTLRLAIAACLVLAVACGIEPVRLGGGVAFALGVLGVAASLGYAAGPRPYAALGLADPLFFAMFGIVAVAGAYGVQAAAQPGFVWTALPWRTFVLGLPVGCLVTAVLVVDDLRDRHFDARKGWRTTAVRHGVAGSRREFVLLIAAGYLLPIAFWLGLGEPATVLLPLLTLPVAWSVVRAVRRFDSTRDLLPITPRTALLSLAFAALLAFGVAAGRP